ncbi:MAG: hypothetical protein ACRC1T_09915 [Clostridium chrysemydis]|uniref:hypothetical protein n=1 Tax=Clostridium chrysemydis TaxID=2665504 RepID=UPI003F3CFC2A
MLIIKRDEYFDEKEIAYCHKDDLKMIKQDKFLRIIFTGISVDIETHGKKLSFEEMEEIRYYIMAEIEADAEYSYKELVKVVQNSLGINPK